MLETGLAMSACIVPGQELPEMCRPIRLLRCRLAVSGSEILCEHQHVIVINPDAVAGLDRDGLIDDAPTVRNVAMSDLSAAGVSQDEQARQITDIPWKAAESGFSGPAFIFRYP
jgi:hypothetical protein